MNVSRELAAKLLQPADFGAAARRSPHHGGHRGRGLRAGRRRSSAASWWAKSFPWSGIRTPKSSPCARSTRAAKRCESSAARRTSRAGMKAPLREGGRQASRKWRSRRRRCAAWKATACCARRASSACPTTTRACSSCRRTQSSARTCAQCSGSTSACMTLKLTPNRADCLSILGVAREVSALTGARLAVPEIPPVPARSTATAPGAHRRARRAAAGSPGA